MMWQDILKNIQITSQRGKTKDIRLPPKVEEEDDNCLKALRRMVSRIEKLPLVINRGYFKDTYLNADKIARIQHPLYPKFAEKLVDAFAPENLEGLSEHTFCFWVRNLRNLPSYEEINFQKREHTHGFGRDKIRYNFMMLILPIKSMDSDTKVSIDFYEVTIRLYTAAGSICNFTLGAKTYEQALSFIREAIQ